MLTSPSSPTTPLDRQGRRAKARHRQREAAAPYPLLKRKRGGEKRAEEEEEGTCFGRGTASAGGFFTRLASYIPIVNKLVKTEDTEEAQGYDDVQTTQEDVEEEEEEEEVMPRTEKTETQKTSETVEKEKTLEKEAVLAARVSPVSCVVPSFVSRKEQPTTSSRNISNEKGSWQLSFSSRESSTKSGEQSPAMMQPQWKRGEKRVFLPGTSQQSKRLHIANNQRQRLTSSSPYDSALAMIKKKKVITPEEFERLQHQLHELVETTPQAQLAMTQAALSNGLEHPITRGFPGPTSFPGYVPGSIASQNDDPVEKVIQDERERESEHATKSGVPFGKLPKNCENKPILFSGSSLRGKLTREKRLMRKLRPSRLLTGAKRNISVRNTYSAAVVEKIISTLNKMQTPLEREAQKLTPSTPMSWAKYHLSLVDDQSKSLKNGMEIDSDDVPPPTATVPRVVFPQPSMKPAALSFGSAPNTAFDTPSKSANAVSNGVTSLFSPQAVSMTPAPTTKTFVPKQQQLQTTGEFKFTLPLRAEGMMQVAAGDADFRVQFVFSPPPSMCEPPVKVSSRKTAKFNSGAAPFNFMPSSPKMKSSEWMSKPQAANEPKEPKADEIKSVAAETAEESRSGSTAAAPTTSISGVVNPLARFMQLKPGQWKCSGCSVMNEATSAKCPCCETAKPGGGATEKTSSAAPNAPGKISSIGFGIGVTTVDAKKDTDKPAVGSITEGGFRFGAPFVDSRKDTEKPVSSISSSGFSFGTPAAEDADKFPTEITSDGFNFTAHAASSEKSTAGDSSFCTTTASNARADFFASTAPISFGLSAPVRSTDDAFPKKTAVTGKAASAPPFSFGVSAASTPAPDITSAATNSTSVSSGFTFSATSTNTADGTSKGKRKAPEAEVSTNDSAPSFSFGTTTPANTEAPKENPAVGFGFGVLPEPKQASLTESDRPTKRLAGSVAASDSKPDASVFSFGTALKSPQISAKESAKTPSFIFSSTTAQNLKQTTTSASSFGATSTEKASAPTKAKFSGMMLPKTGSAFGSSSASEPKPTADFGQDTESEGLAFSFGGSAPVSSAPATSTSASSSTGFTFGQSTPFAASSASAFGVAPSASAFGFGASTLTPPPSLTSTPPITEMSLTAASTPAFTFGSSSGSSTFGQTPASTSRFGSTSTAFGSSSSNVFGSGSHAGGFGSSSTAAPSTTFGNVASSAPAFSFEASSQAPAANAPAPTATQPVFSFGAPSAPAPTGYGAAPGFGPSASSGGFGAAAGGFRSSSPAPAFGNQSAPAFGSTRPPPFGAPAFGAPACSGFGSGPSSSGFRTPIPTPAFGPAQAAPAFGAAPNTAFGATAPAPGFGATAPSLGFGAPTAGAFSASVDGGFNMGAAPQHAKGRRILKAKSRKRRTS